MNFESAISSLKTELRSKYGKSAEVSASKEGSRREELISKIESVVLGIMESVANGRAPALKATELSHWSNSVFEDRVKVKGKGKTRVVDFGNDHSRSNFTTIIFLLSKIHKLLSTRETSTRRELYYKNLEVFRSQGQVDRGMRDVCCVLDAPTWELRVLATSKGIVSGPLVLKLPNGESLDCGRKGGVSIPMNVTDVEEMSSSAAWVLVVEKDASFQRIVADEDGPRLQSCIVITGKGYPDVNTRILVRVLWEHLRIPILTLVDADPDGFEIMCVYRFGSLSMSPHSSHLACPAVRWLGVHPVDIKPLFLDSKELSPRDVRKIHLLMQRPYVEENESLKTQLKILLDGNVKAEIEGVSDISTKYLTDAYIKNKIRCKDYF